MRTIRIEVDISPMLYCMALRADDTVRMWELSNKQEYDTATVGSSALLAALERDLNMEVAMFLEILSAAIFNDCHVCFDSVDIPHLIGESIQVQFPPGEMCVSLQQHLAPRVIQVNGFSSLPVTVVRSILQGCKYSVAFTRAYIQRRMKRLHARFSDANTRVYIDDTSMFATDPELPQVLDKLVPAVTTFARDTKIAKLALSPKAVLTASNLKLALLLKKNLNPMA